MRTNFEPRKPTIQLTIHNNHYSITVSLDKEDGLAQIPFDCKSYLTDVDRRSIVRCGLHHDLDL